MLPPKYKTEKKVVDLSVYGQGYDTEDLIREAEKEEHLNRQRNVEIGDVFVWEIARLRSGCGSD